MPLFDTPITTDDHNLNKVLAQKQPAVLLLYDGRQKNESLQTTLQSEAKKHAGELLVIRVDANQNPQTLAEYGHPRTPALVTLIPAPAGRQVKSKAENILPADFDAHVEHLLNDAPLPQMKADAPKPEPNKSKAGHVTDANFREDVLNSEQPVLVDFWAAWCGPCLSIAPFVEQMAGQYAGKVKIVKLNTDENRATMEQYRVQSIPTFILFKNGQVVKRFSGANPQQLQAILAEAAK